jgi:hypothetical protein
MSDLPILLTMEDVAIRLHISRRKLQDILKDLPYYREVGRRKLFTESDFAALIEALPSPAKAMPAQAPAPQSSEALYRRLRVLTAKKPRKRGQSA